MGYWNNKIIEQKKYLKQHQQRTFKYQTTDSGGSEENNQDKYQGNHTRHIHFKIKKLKDKEKLGKNLDQTIPFL